MCCWVVKGTPRNTYADGVETVLLRLQPVNAIVSIFGAVSQKLDEPPVQEVVMAYVCTPARAGSAVWTLSSYWKWFPPLGVTWVIWISSGDVTVVSRTTEI